MIVLNSWLTVIMKVSIQLHVYLFMYGGNGQPRAQPLLEMLRQIFSQPPIQLFSTVFIFFFFVLFSLVDIFQDIPFSCVTISTQQTVSDTHNRLKIPT